MTVHFTSFLGKLQTGLLAKADLIRLWETTLIELRVTKEFVRVPKNISNTVSSNSIIKRIKSDKMHFPITGVSR